MGTSLEMLPAGTEQLSSEEEGEIIELDDDDDEPVELNGGFRIPSGGGVGEFEDISSDEELNLRQRIEELEARNQELEQIAAISKTATDDFGSFRISRDYCSHAIISHYSVIAPTPQGAATIEFDYVDLVDADSSPDRQQQPLLPPQRHHRHHNHNSVQYHNHDARYSEHSHNTRHQPRHRTTTANIETSTRPTSTPDAIDSRHRSYRQHSKCHRHEHHKHRTAAVHRRSGDPPRVAEPPDAASLRYDNADNQQRKRRRLSPALYANDTAANHMPSSQRHRADRSDRPDHRLSHAAIPRESRTQHRQHRQPHQQRHQPNREQRPQRQRRTPTRSRSASSSASSTSSSSSSSSSTSTTTSSTNSIMAALHGTTYRPDRNVLRAAVKRDTGHSRAAPSAPPVPPPITSTLQHKLLGSQQCVTPDIVDDVADIDADDVDASASIEIMALLDTLTDERIIDAHADGSERSSPVTGDENTKSLPQLEAISLEEQELRLAALKSAVLKKHEARKQRKVLEARPYSPTDTDIVMDSVAPSRANRLTVDAANTAVRVNNSLHTDDDEPLNMEISPGQSPSTVMTPWLLDTDADIETAATNDADKILQPVDMELSDGSTSPEYPLGEDDEVDDDATVAPTPPLTLWAPLPPDARLPSAEAPPDDIRSFGIFQQHEIPPPPPPPLDKSVMAAAKLESSRRNVVEAASLPFDDEEEAALRALLLSTKVKRKPTAAVADPLPVGPVVEPVPARTSDAAADDDAAQLRSIAMQSLSMRAQQTTRTAVPAVPLTTTAYDNSQKENDQRPVAALPRSSTPILIKTIPNNILIDTNRQSVPVAEACLIRSSANVITIVPTVNATSPAQPQPVPITISPTKAAAMALKRKAIAIANIARKRAAAAPAPAKRTGSALITHMSVKTVKPVIIQCSAHSDSDSDEWAAADGGFFHDGNDTNGAATSSVDRFFDPASPASLVMDPTVLADDSNSNGARKSPLFEQKVDEYLRMVRRTIQHSEPQPLLAKSELDASTKTTTANRAAAVAQPSPKPTPKKPTKMMVTTTTGPATPLVVRHLPLSSQAEYKQLVLRMSMLEQKRSKQQLEKLAASKSSSTGGQPVVVRKTTLIKQVLVRNGAEALADIRSAAICAPTIPNADHDAKPAVVSAPQSPTAGAHAEAASKVTEEAATAEQVATEKLLRTIETSFQTKR